VRIRPDPGKGALASSVLDVAEKESLVDLFLCLRVLTTAALLVAIGGVPTAQVPFDRVRDVLGNRGPMRASGGDAPVTTSIDRATTEVASFDGFEPARWLPLGDQPQDGSGVFQVAPGSYEFQAASYCLHAGTHGPGRGDGYLYAPLEGSRSGVIRAILQGSVRHPELRQQDIQVLLWAILARTPFDQMPRRAQLAAASLLTPGQLLGLGVGSFPVMTPGIWDGGGRAMPPAMARVFQAESRLRQLFARADTPYAEFERVAVLLGEPEPDAGRRDVPRGRWSYHPDGYFIRFFPSGYDKTTIQVHVPEPATTAGTTEAAGEPGFRFASRAEPYAASTASSSAGRPVPVSHGGTVRVDLTDAVAVPAARGRQRLAMSGRER
jgi:hypothetical protein